MISVQDLSHSYPERGTVLRNVSFEVSPGEKVALLGVNGSGKTTLLKILDGLIHPDGGRYRYRGRPVTRGALKDRAFGRVFRREVVLLFQNPDTMIFNATVHDEIAFGLRQLGVDDVDGRVRHWAELLGLGPYLREMPFRLSSGEKQKVCLAALLALDPKLLLLDEPTANLDPMTTGWLVDLVQSLELTTIMTTHNLSLAQEFANRALVLSDAHQLIYDGDLDRFLDDEEMLLKAKLVHTHRHRHGETEHRHYHVHDWD